MTEYKPFWTEQSTTTITKPSENTKTYNDHTLFIFAFVVGIIVIFVSLTAESYYKGQKELEFVKAGLVQKVENGNEIWTNP